MRSQTEALLVREVEPRLRNTIPKYVSGVGCDDHEELLQDGIVIALQLARQARKAGKKVSGSNLAHYTLLHLRMGRRSTGYKKNDVLHPAARLNGHSRVQSLDEPISQGEHGEEPLTLQDCLAAPLDDPATIAARRLDWETVITALDRTSKAILIALVEGTELTRLVRRLRRSRSSLQTDKARLERKIREHLGHDILRQVQAQPAWTDTMEALRERLLCRAERRAA